MRVFVLTIAAVWLTIPLSAFAAGPRLIMIHGAPLTKPVIMDNWQENIDLIHATANDAGISLKELANRTFVEVELFSGPYWVEYAEADNVRDTLQPESADQRARFYPAVQGRPAVMAYEAGLPRQVDAKGLAILQRHGIPVSLDSRQSSVATLGILVAVSLLIVFAGWRINKRLKEVDYGFDPR